MRCIRSLLLIFMNTVSVEIWSNWRAVLFGACASCYVHSSVFWEWPFLCVSVLFSLESAIWPKSKIWGYLPPIYLKIHTSTYAPGMKCDSFFQDATSWRQYQGGPDLAVTSNFAWRQRVPGARMSKSSCFCKVTLQCVQSTQERGGSVLNGKQREDVLPLLSLLCDKGTM